VSLPKGFDYFPGWVAGEDADDLLRRLHEELPWRQYTIRLFGRERLQPRLTGWCSDPGVEYRYSGLCLGPTPWHSALGRLRHDLQMQLHSPFNCVLANAYRDGQDAMGWHADDEPELGEHPLIASISLGQARTLRIRPRGGGPSLALLLEHGSLLVMSGSSQSDWQHAVPRSRKPLGLRINLTFRRILKS
jgi:alkylated DNA repair dioxygenase AlkB